MPQGEVERTPARVVALDVHCGHTEEGWTDGSLLLSGNLWPWLREKLKRLERAQTNPLTNPPKGARESRRLEHLEQMPDLVVDLILGADGVGDGAAQDVTKLLPQSMGGGLDGSFGESVAGGDFLIRCRTGR